MAGIGTAHLRPAEQALIRAEHLVVEYPTRRGVVQAVSDVSFDVLPGETVGIVGESGCGKSTTARALLQLPPATGGSVRLDGHELTGLSRSELREARRQMQIILQDPISSINPRRTIGDVVAEPLDIWGVAPGERAARVDQALDSVGLVPDHVRSRRRHELSGGQCQRVCIARALIGGPRLLVCDEAVSALDVSVQAQVLNVIRDVRQQYGLSMLFISHDLSVVWYLSDRVVVMYLGRICEIAAPDDLFGRPLHPYTKVLVDSIPVVDPDTPAVRDGLLEGDLPSPLDPPTGCRFRTRCSRADERCTAEAPTIVELAPGRFVACHHPLDPQPDPPLDLASPSAAEEVR